MEMTDDKLFDSDELDNLLAEAAQNRPEPGSELLARVMADADLVMAQNEAARPEIQRPARPGIFASLLKSIGGWPAMAGLVSATVAGVWIGYGSPAALDDLSAGYLGVSAVYDLGDLMPSIDIVLQEG